MQLPHVNPPPPLSTPPVAQLRLSSAPLASLETAFNHHLDIPFPQPRCFDNDSWIIFLFSGSCRPYWLRTHAQRPGASRTACPPQSIHQDTRRHRFVARSMCAPTARSKRRALLLIWQQHFVETRRFRECYCRRDGGGSASRECKVAHVASRSWTCRSRRNKVGQDGK